MLRVKLAKMRLIRTSVTASSIVNVAPSMVRHVCVRSYWPSRVVPRKSSSPSKIILEGLYLRDGLSTREIGQLYGRDAGTVREWLIKYDIARRPAKTKISPPPKQWLAQCYSELGSAHEVGKLYGVSKRLVLKWLRTYAIPVAPMGGFRYGTKLAHLSHQWWYDAYVVEARDMQDIADELGCAISAVSNTLKRLGIASRRNGWRRGWHTTYPCMCCGQPTSGGSGRRFIDIATDKVLCSACHRWLSKRDVVIEDNASFGAYQQVLQMLLAVSHARMVRGLGRGAPGGGTLPRSRAT